MHAVLRRVAEVAPGAPLPADQPVGLATAKSTFATRTLTGAGEVQNRPPTNSRCSRCLSRIPTVAIAERLSMLAQGEHEVFDRAVDVPGVAPAQTG